MHASQHDSSEQSFENTDSDLGTLPETQYIIRPDSTISSFSLQIILPLAASLPPSSDGKRGIAPIQPGGRLLLYDTVPLDGNRIQILLTLHSDSKPDSYRVVGQLVGKSLPPRVEAHLQVGDRAYQVQVSEGRFEIRDVEFDGGVENLSFRLGTPD